MPAWSIPLLSVIGSSVASGLMAAGTQLGFGATWKQVLAAFLVGAGSGGALHAVKSPLPPKP